MALINCPECTKEISNKAKSCPNCGMPIENDLTIQLEKKLGKKLIYPDLPIGYTIGQMLTNWSGSTELKGEFNSEENTVKALKSGKVNVMIHEQGIAIGNSLIPKLKIHFKRLIKIEDMSGKELVKQNKSITGRAIVGGILLGPVGAIIGGMSAMKQEKLKKFHYLIINYWNGNKEPTTLIIRSKEVEINAFLNALRKQKTKANNQPILIKKVENRKARKGCLIFGIGSLVLLSIFNIFFDKDEASNIPQEVTEVVKPKLSTNNVEKTQIQLIGSWRYNFQQMKGNVKIFKSDNNLEARLKFNGEKEVTKEQLKKVGKKYIIEKSKFGEYYIINSNGTLGVYDKDGLLTTCIQN